MNAFEVSAMPEWKVTVLVGMTLVVIASAHWHSYRAAWREMRARNLSSRHQLHYSRQTPLMMLFVGSSVVVVAYL